MSSALILLPTCDRLNVPNIIAGAGPAAAERFLEFFTVQIRNINTRQCYARMLWRFFTWMEQFPVQLTTIRPMHVAAFIESLRYSKATGKLHLAVIRTLFNWFLVTGVAPLNPATPVRGPKNIVKIGKTPVIEPDGVQALFDSIDAGTICGARDRALLGIMLYSFARVSAVVAMNIADYRKQGPHCTFRLHEKGGKYHEVPAHHIAQQYVDEYLLISGRSSRPKHRPLFTTMNGTRVATENRVSRSAALAMVKRRAQAAGLPLEICCHSFRATGITTYLANGGSLESAQLIACHESMRTTKLYDRNARVISANEIERIAFWRMLVSSPNWQHRLSDHPLNLCHPDHSRTL